MQKPHNFGFVREEILPDQYVFGGVFSLPKVVLREDGDWSSYLPQYEPQFNSTYDTYGCTVFGTQNCIEILENFIYKKETNHSERYTYILAGITPPGSDPHKVAEIIRKYGLVDDKDLPMTPSFEFYLQPDPMDRSLLKKGREWLKKHDFGHEWVFTGRPDKKKRIELLKENLKYSPIAVSVTAWITNQEGLYIDDGKPNTHWCVCFGLKEKDGEYYPLILDSYDQTLKVLHPDHHIEVAKRYTLKKKQEKSWWREILEQLFLRYDKA